MKLHKLFGNFSNNKNSSSFRKGLNWNIGSIHNGNGLAAPGAPSLRSTKQVICDGISSELGPLALCLPPLWPASRQQRKSNSASNGKLRTEVFSVILFYPGSFVQSF